MTITLSQICADFSLLDDWEDRYRYVIELGRKLPAFSPEARTDANKVRGCASQVWLVTHFVTPTPSAPPRFVMAGDSDAHIVRGLISILLAFYNGKPPDEVLRADPGPVFRELGLNDHLTPQRSNGLASMVERIRSDARAAVSAGARGDAPYDGASSTAGR